VKWLTAIVALAGKFAAVIFPAWAKESRKPREVKVVGHDKDTHDDIGKSIERRARGSRKNP
jgi:hypothetical protein